MGYKPSGKAAGERITALSDDESEKLETAFKLADRGEEFAKLFCDVAKEYTSVKKLLVDTLVEMLESNAKAREALKGIIRELQKEDSMAFLKTIGGKAAAAGWTILVLVAGIFLEKWFGG